MTIPAALIKKLGLTVGSKIDVEITPAGDAFLVKQVKPAKKTKKTTAEFKKWLDQVLIEDKEILDELDKR